MTLNEIQTQLETATDYASLHDKEAFHQLFPPKTFTAEQKAVLRQFWLVVPSDTELETANSANARINISPIETVDGRKVVSIDLLTEPCQCGQLENWEIVKLDASDFPIPDEEIM